MADFDLEELVKFRNVSIFKPRRRNKRHHPWLIAVTAGGKRHVTAGSSDYGDTIKIAERLSKIAQRVDGKVADAFELRQEIERRKPLTHHLNRYERHMRACGKTAKHALQMRLYAEEALEKFNTIDDVIGEDVQAAVWSMKLTAVTKNRRLYAVTAFLNWGVPTRWPRELADRISLERLPQSKTRPRRVLSVDDLVHLIHTAEVAGTVAGVTGKQRALMYRTLVSTGLRFGELTRLRIEHVRDTGFYAPASVTKNRKEAHIAVPANLMIEIMETVKGRDKSAPIFPVQKFNPDRMLKHDLAAAGIPRVTERGVFDFHSFRHQCATLLAASGAQAKVIQSQMRHASIQLTMDTYGHLFDKDRYRAADLLGKIVQRRAQRAGSVMPDKTLIPAWSDGESNPDLLNAIEQSASLIEIHLNELRNKRGKRIAPRAAPRLLRRLYSRAGRRKGAGQ